MSGSHNYDRITGQTFKEWLVRPSAPDEVPWYRTRARQPYSRRPDNCNAEGARSLVDVAIRLVAEHFSLLEVDDLEHVPSPLISRIYDYMEIENFHISLQSFKIFARRLGPLSMPVSIYRSHYDINRPNGPLSLYMNPLTSSSFDFIVHLTLTGPDLPFDTHQLLSLTQLKNLGVLEILQPELPGSATFPRVSDAVIRQWSQEPDPFPVLRVMRIWGDDFTTTRSLQYLSRFPALAVYDVAGLGRDWGEVPKVPGWASTNQSWSRKDNVRTMRRHFDLLGANANTRPDQQMDTSLLVTHELRDYDGRLDTTDLPRPLQHGNVGVADRAQLGVIDTHNRNIKPSGYQLVEDLRYIFAVELGVSAWGHLLYCHVGQLRSDRDLIAQGLRDASQAYLANGERLIPPRPYAIIRLGQCSSAKNKALAVSCNFGTDRRFEAHWTFARAEIPSEPDGQASSSGTKRPPESPHAPRLRKQPKAFPTEQFRNM
ncbi:hypothetical protein GGR52DRAFT_189462 [Hypoxylon sp. FL1284]|nr:hypothetical protein GGR52DRAFT_189462 [Hypoxylon sp. FL1284]